MILFDDGVYVSFPNPDHHVVHLQNESVNNMDKAKSDSGHTTAAGQPSGRSEEQIRNKCRQSAERSDIISKHVVNSRETQQKQSRHKSAQTLIMSRKRTTNTKDA